MYMYIYIHTCIHKFPEDPEFDEGALLLPGGPRRPRLRRDCRPCFHGGVEVGESLPFRVDSKDSC